jgi:hypothetical protein
MKRIRIKNKIKNKLEDNNIFLLKGEIEKKKSI